MYMDCLYLRASRTSSLLPVAGVPPAGNAEPHITFGSESNVQPDEDASDGWSLTRVINS
jgi:hypothetical protein